MPSADPQKDDSKFLTYVIIVLVVIIVLYLIASWYGIIPPANFSGVALGGVF